VTKTIESYRAEINGQSIVLVDTIGFDDTDLTDEQVLGRVAKWLYNTYEDKVALAGIIYVHDITSRLGGSAMRSLRTFKQLIGESALRNVVLVANKWNLGNHDENENKLQKLSESEDLWGGMINKGSATARCTGTTQDAHRIIGSILKLERRTLLTIQQEMVYQDMDVSETDAGRMLLDENQRLKARAAEQEREVINLQTDLITLQEQNAIPPPPYTEVGSQDSRPREAFKNNASALLWAMLVIIRALALSIWEHTAKLARPKVQPGYRRLDWRCVR
jgi:hypothetical protein